MPGVFPDYPAIENPPVLRGHKVSPGIANGAPSPVFFEVIKLDLDIRFVVISLDVGSAEWIFKDE
jgi:hypothetical protein